MRTSFQRRPWPGRRNSLGKRLLFFMKLRVVRRAVISWSSVTTISLMMRSASPSRSITPESGTSSMTPSAFKRNLGPCSTCAAASSAPAAARAASAFSCSSLEMTFLLSSSLRRCLTASQSMVRICFSSADSFPMRTVRAARESM